jgi:hypothetical protein
MLGSVKPFGNKGLFKPSKRREKSSLSRCYQSNRTQSRAVHCHDETVTTTINNTTTINLSILFYVSHMQDHNMILELAWKLHTNLVTVGPLVYRGIDLASCGAVLVAGMWSGRFINRVTPHQKKLLRDVCHTTRRRRFQGGVIACFREPRKR